MRKRTATATLVVVALTFALIGPSISADDSERGVPDLLSSVIAFVVDLFGLDSAESNDSEGSSDPEPEGGPFVVPDG